MKAATLALFLILVGVASYTFVLRFLPEDSVALRFLNQLGIDIPKNVPAANPIQPKAPQPTETRFVVPEGSFRGPTGQPSIKGPSANPPNE